MITDWDNKLPRFLFRGFHAASGARAVGTGERHELCDVGSLNTKKHIIPYAFRPKGIKIMENIMAGPENQRPGTKELIEGHVFNCSGPDEDCPIWGPTPFSSWTPDLHTALYFARLQWEVDDDGNVVPTALRKYPRIAVLDTHMLSTYAETQDVRVYHTKALAQIFEEPDWDLRTEYLVYGKVSGPAYDVVCVDKIQEVANLAGSCWRTLEGQASTATLSRHNLTKDEVLKAKKMAELFQRDDEDQPDVIIALVAAELARLQYDTGVPLPYPKQLTLSVKWEERDIDMVVDTVSSQIDALAGMDKARRTLVNPRQCTHALPNVGMMTNMLMGIQLKIPPPSPTPSEKRRRADASRVTKSKKKIGVTKKILNKMLKKQ